MALAKPLLSALFLLAPSSVAVASVSTETQEVDLKAQFTKLREAAKGDAKKLWELVSWCEAKGLDKERRSCLRDIIDIDDDKKAHELLGHVLHEGKWFPSEEKVAEHKKAQAAKLAKEQGLVEFRGEWVHPEDIPFLEKGLRKSPDGTWVNEEEAKRIAEGWKQQDLEWIAPAEFEQLEQGLWKCGSEWKTLEEANAYHAELGQWWRLPGTYFHLYTTLPRSVAVQALAEIDRTYRDLARVYGVEPAQPMIVVLLNSTDQYRLFAAGKEGGWEGTDALGLSSVHGAFFADGLIDRVGRKWMGTGAGYWDPSSESGTSFGKLFARHAAGQSFGEHVDPSPKAIEKFETTPQSRFNAEEYYAEKQVPLWLRYGAASYVERYFADAFAGPGEDPLRLRTWSVENLARRGGLDPCATIFEMKLSPENPDSEKLISEAGLLVAFMVDGDCAPVKEAHAALKAALKSRTNVDKAVTALQAALEKNADQLRKFAKL
jgi:hypothetical protein